MSELDQHTGVVVNSSNRRCSWGGGGSLVLFAQGQTEDVRALYCCYLRKEMENLDQQMAFRALKMKKLEKEILLLDKQLV